MKRGFTPISIIILVIAALISGILYYANKRTSQPGGQLRTPCTMEAKQCPDGSFVGRIGPKCEFANCPNLIPPVNINRPAGSKTECKSDSDCPSPAYSCQAIEGFGTLYPNNSRAPTYQIIKGECKLKAGGKCGVDSDCLSGLVCHASACTSPVRGQCRGPGDTSCGAGYKCIQACGPPVVRFNEPPPPYYCELNEIANRPRICPICLASNTEISTPTGPVNVRDIKTGMDVWSVNSAGQKIISRVAKVSSTPVPVTHKVVHLVLADGRQLWASPNHPTTDGSVVGALKIGDNYDGSRVSSTSLINYWDKKTFDLLPDSETGYYWANEILMASTLSTVR